MSGRRGERRGEPNHHAADVTSDSDRDGLSLKGEAGKQVAKNLAQFALGKLSLDELGDPRYSLTPDGAVSLELDDESSAALASMTR
jgi:hypothetical protein